MHIHTRILKSVLLPSGVAGKTDNGRGWSRDRVWEYLPYGSVPSYCPSWPDLDPGCSATTSCLPPHARLRVEHRTQQWQWAHTNTEHIHLEPSPANHSWCPPENPGELVPHEGDTVLYWPYEKQEQQTIIIKKWKTEPSICSTCEAMLVIRRFQRLFYIDRGSEPRCTIISLTCSFGRKFQLGCTKHFQTNAILCSWQ